MHFLSFNDLILTPFFLLAIYGFAYALRSKLTDKSTKRFFIPALSLKLFGAIALGVIYELIYGGGDTARYFNESKVITQAFYDSPSIGIKLLLSNGEYDVLTHNYASKMGWYASQTEFFIVKLAGVLGTL